MTLSHLRQCRSHSYDIHGCFACERHRPAARHGRACRSDPSLWTVLADGSVGNHSRMSIPVDPALLMDLFLPRTLTSEDASNFRFAENKIGRNRAARPQRGDLPSLEWAKQTCFSLGQSAVLTFALGHRLGFGLWCGSVHACWRSCNT